MLMIAFTFIDFVRRFYDGNKFLLVSLDVLVVIAYCFYYLGIKRGRLDFRHGKGMMFLLCLLFLLYVWTLLGLFNDAYPSLTVTLAGIRSYWLGVPMIFVGYYMAHHLNMMDYNRIYRYLILLAFTVIAFGFLQAVIDRNQFEPSIATYLTPMGHGVHSYGQELYNLSSSFFASSKRYGKYLLFVYLVLWAINVYRRRSNVMIFLLFSIGMYSSGSREALWIFLLFHIFYHGLLSPKRIRNGIIMAVSVILVLIAVSANSLLVNQGDIAHAGKGVNEAGRISFMLAIGESVSERIQLMMPLTNLRIENEHWFYGIGPGRYGAEALLDPDISEKTRNMDVLFFYPNDYFRSSISFADSGMTKLAIELGVVGVFIYLMLIIFLCWISAIGFMDRKANSFSIAASFWILAWLFFFFKAHVTISDLMLSVFLFGSVGYVLALVGKGRSYDSCILSNDRDMRRLLDRCAADPL